MTRKDIVDAYCRIRRIDQTIPDEVLDFMYNAALERFDHELPPEQRKQLEKERAELLREFRL